MLRDIFLDESCAHPSVDDPRVIFDLGSNIGLSILFFRIRYPRATIFAFEPDPGAFPKLVENVRGIPDVEIHNVAIAPRDEERTLHLSPHSWASSLVRGPASAGTTTVAARSLGSLAAELGVERIDLLKVDIEGGEWELIRESAPGELASVQALVAELHMDSAPADADRLVRGCRAFELELRDGSPGIRVLVGKRSVPGPESR